MDWTDFLNERFGSSSGRNEEAARVEAAIVDLWIAYANFEVSFRQNAKAVEVFENALKDAIAGKAVKSYERYADFYGRRGKVDKARKVYQRALSAGLTAADNSALWQQFVKYMQQSGKEEYSTVSDPQQLMQLLLVNYPAEAAAMAAPSGPKAAENAIAVKEEVDNSVAMDVAESKQTDPDDGTAPEAVPIDAPPQLTIPTDNAGAKDNEQQEAVQQQFKTPDDLDDVSGMTPEQVVRVFSARPPLLFTAPHKEPTASGLNGLNFTDFALLEDYVKVPLSALGSSASTLKVSPRNSEAENLEGMRGLQWADKVMDVLEAMYCTQALKELHFDGWIRALYHQQGIQERGIKEIFIRKRAEEGDSEDIQAAETMELGKFHNHAEVQRELLQAVINKSLYALFIQQQQQLAYMGYPNFSFAFTEKLQDIIEKRKAAVSSGNGSVSRDSIFGTDPEVIDSITSQRNLVCALLSVRLMMVTAEMSRQQRVKREQSFTSVSNNNATSGEKSAVANNATQGSTSDSDVKKPRKRRRTLSGTDANSGYSSGDLTPGIEQQIHDEGEALLAPILNAYAQPSTPVTSSSPQLEDDQKQVLLQQVANMMKK